MNPLSAIMGLADLASVGIVFYFMGFSTIPLILAVIIIPKAVMSFA